MELQDSKKQFRIILSKWGRHNMTSVARQNHSSLVKNLSLKYISENVIQYDIGIIISLQQVLAYYGKWDQENFIIALYEYTIIHSKYGSYSVVLTGFDRFTL